MSFPCCMRAFQGVACGNAPSVQACLDLAGDDFIRVGPEGATCRHADGSGGCWSCEFEPPFEVTRGYCFDITGDQPDLGYFETWPSNCSRCNAMGISCIEAASAEDCGPPPPEPDNCRMAMEDRIAEDGRQWTADLLGTVGIGLDSERHSDGYTHTLSSELVRARAESTGISDPCGHAAAKIVVLSDGHAYGELCSQPQWDKAESRRRSYAVVRTVQDTPSMKDGYQYAIALVHLPWWAETVYRSNKVYCGEIER